MSDETLADDFVVVEEGEEESSEQENHSETSPQVEEKTPVKEGFDFKDPQNLPPELKDYYNGMQASYTKRQQGVTDALRNLEPHAERLQILDRAQKGDFQAQAQIASMLGLNLQAPGQPQVQKQDEPVDVDSFETPSQLVAHMEKRQELAIKQALGAFQQQLVPHIRGLQQQQQQQLARIQDEKSEAEYLSVKAKYPDFDNYIDNMIELRKSYPGLGMEKAYQLATYRKPVLKSSGTNRPGKSSSSVRQKSKKIDSYEEAALAALEELEGN